MKPHALILAVAFAGTLVESLATGQPQAETPRPAGKRYALLVGVNHYEHPRLREPQPLKYAVADVTALGTILTGLGYEVTLLTDETGRRDAGLRPTKANVERHLREVLRRSGARDTVVLGFAGHGLQFVGQKDAYFCPTDARPFADESETLVSISKMYAELEKSFAGVKVILIDACRNDPDPGRGRGLDADSAPAPPRGVAALFSCSAGQKAYEHDQLKHGVFFHHVLEGLKGEAADRSGEVTFDGLSAYVRRHVPDTLERLLPGREQFPNLKADLAGRPPVLARISPTPIRPLEGSRAGELRTFNAPLDLKLAWCPPGSFRMGSPDSDTDAFDHEKPAVSVTLTRGFWLGQTEVTQRQWKSVMGAEPWKRKEYVKEGDDYPATYVGWEEAMEFCRRLTEQERAAGRLPSGREYTLPTEAQWEYACRAGTQTKYSFGDDAGRLSEYAWWGGLLGDGNARQERYAHAVRTKKANPWGLYDMHGNVWEWCRDVYANKLPGGRNPLVTSGGSRRVYRGGSWRNAARNCRSADRFRFNPSDRYDYLGFRLALSPSGE